MKVDPPDCSISTPVLWGDVVNIGGDFSMNMREHDAMSTGVPFWVFYEMAATSVSPDAQLLSCRGLTFVSIPTAVQIKPKKVLRRSVPSRIG